MKTRPWVYAGLVVLGSFMLPFAPCALAQQDNPSRVIRLIRVEGGVFVSHKGSANREPARIHQPLRQGDTLFTAENGLAEIGLETGATVSLESNSALRLDQQAVSDGHNVTQMTAQQGAASFDIWLAPGDVFRVATSTFDVAIPDGAACRIHALSDGAWVETLQGRITVSTKAGSTTLKKGQEVAIHSSDFLYLGVARALYPNLFKQLFNLKYGATKAQVPGAASALNNKNLSNILNLPELSEYRLWLEYPGLSFTWPGNTTTQGAQPSVNGNWKLDPSLGWMYQTNPTGGLAPATSGTWQLNPALGWIQVPNAPTAAGNPNGQ